MLTITNARDVCDEVENEPMNLVPVFTLSSLLENKHVMEKDDLFTDLVNV